MSVLDAYRDRLDRMLAELAAENRVPGAVCGLLLGDDVHVSTWGVANAATGTPVGPDTLFQIGSITKVYTATLVMQAVGAGVISLDEPVRAQLQEFMVADPAATIEITPRHLLAHTSGLEGDHLIDTGWNADALSRYVATLAGLAQIHATDQAYSFCNTGYGVVGRLLEVATGEDYDRVLRRRLTRPLGCRATVTLPHHALLHNVAVGHVQSPGEAAVRQPRWVLTRSNGPMGGVMAPAGELLDFARMHLAEGCGPDGTDLLAPVAAATMQHPQVESPVPGEAHALGWTVRQWGDLICLGQDADTFGQRAVLRVVPERDFAVCVMANSQMGATVAQGVLEGVATELLDVPADLDPAVARPDPGGDGPGARGSGAGADGDRGDAPAGTVADLSRYSGAYERLHQRIVATTRDGQVRLATEPSGVLQALGVRHVELDMAATGVDIDGNIALAGVDPATGGREVAVLVPPAGGQPPGLYLAGRLHRRVR